MEQKIFKDIIKMSYEMSLAQTKKILKIAREAYNREYERSFVDRDIFNVHVFDEVRRILEEGDVNLNGKDEYDNNLLYYVSPDENLSLDLLERGVIPSRVDLSKAIRYNNYRVVSEILRRHPVLANMRTSGYYGSTILQELSEASYDKRMMFSVLLPYITDEMLSLENLQRFWFRGLDNQMNDFFLRLGVNIDLQDIYGNTALIIASGQLDVDKVRMLLERDADPNLQNKRGDTALSKLYFIRNTEYKQTERKEILQLLLEFGADPSITDGLGDSAISIAYRLGLDDEVELMNRYSMRQLI